MVHRQQDSNFFSWVRVDDGDKRLIDIGGIIYVSLIEIYLQNYRLGLILIV